MTLDSEISPSGPRGKTEENVRSILTEYLHFGESATNLNPAEFVKRLENVGEMIKGLHGIRTMYKLNNKLENETSNDLKEMDFYVREMKAVLKNICRLKSNKMDINKELNAIKGRLEKKSKEEIQEMETIIAVYDKDLLKKWHVARRTTSINSMENFINNLVGKKKALDNVCKMASDRLAFLKKNNTNEAEALHLKFTGTPTVISNVETGWDSDGQLNFC